MSAGMPRVSANKRASLGAHTARYTHETADNTVHKQPKSMVRASADPEHTLHSTPPDSMFIQVTTQRRRSAAVHLIYDVRADDENARDAVDAAAPLQRSGLRNLGCSCFINGTLQLLLHPLLACLPARPNTPTTQPTLCARAVQAALHVALGLQCSHDALQALVCALPQGFGWQLGQSDAVITVQEDAHEFALKLLEDYTSTTPRYRPATTHSRPLVHSRCAPQPVMHDLPSRWSSSTWRCRSSCL